MTHRIKSTLFIALFSLFSNQAYSQGSEIPQSYMLEKYGSSSPFYCDLEDPIEEIACVSWDSALGSIRRIQESGGVEIEYSEGLFHTLFSVNALNLIQQIVSYPNDYLYTQSLNLAETLNDLQSGLCVARNYGRCGNHQNIFGEVLDFAGIRSRRLSLYMMLDGVKFSHAVSEFYAFDQWMFVDVTNGAIWRDPANRFRLLSFDEVLSLNHESRLESKSSNNNDLWYFVNTYLHEKNERPVNQFEYLDHRTQFLGILRDGSGRTIIDLSLGSDALLQQPNYVGSNHEFSEGISSTISLPGEPVETNLSVNLTVSEVGGCSSHGSTLVDENGSEYPLEKGDNLIAIDNGVIFTAKREEGEVCYIVFGGISLVQ